MKCFKGCSIKNFILIFLIPILFYQVGCSLDDPKPNPEQSDSANDRNTQASNATFYIDFIDGYYQDGLENFDSIFRLPISHNYTFTACLKDLARRNPIVHHEFEVFDTDQTLKSIERTRQNGCLTWTEVIPFHFVSNSQNITLIRTIKSKGVHRGETLFKAAINPWKHGLSHPKDVIDLINNKVPQVVSPELSSLALTGFDPLQRTNNNSSAFIVTPTRGNLFVRTYLGSDENNQLLGFRMGLSLSFKAHLELLNLNGQIYNHALTKGEFKVTPYLIQKYEENGHEFTRILNTNTQSALVNMRNTIAITDQLSFDMPWLPTAGNLFLLLSVEPIGTILKRESFEGEFSIGDFRFRTGFITFNETERSYFSNRFSERNFSIKKIIDDDLGLPDSDFQKTNDDGFPLWIGSNLKPAQFEIDTLNIRFNRYGKETTTRRTVHFTVSTCIKDPIFNSAIGQDKLFKIYKIQKCPLDNVDSLKCETDDSLINGAGQPDSRVIYEVTANNANGCITWPDQLTHTYYEKQLLQIKDFLIVNEQLNLKQKLSVAINPWDYGFTFGRDLRELESKEGDLNIEQLKYLQSQPASTYWLAGVAYNALGFKYEIDDLLNLHLKKQFLFRIDPDIMMYHSRVWGQQLVEYLRNGTWLIHLALQRNMQEDTSHTGDYISSQTKIVESVRGKILTIAEFDIQDVRLMGSRNNLLIEIAPIHSDLVCKDQNGQFIPLELFKKSSNKQICNSEDISEDTLKNFDYSRIIHHSFELETIVDHLSLNLKTLHNEIKNTLTSHGFCLDIETYLLNTSKPTCETITTLDKTHKTKLIITQRGQHSNIDLLINALKNNLSNKEFKKIFNEFKNEPNIIKKFVKTAFLLNDADLEHGSSGLDSRTFVSPFIPLIDNMGAGAIPVDEKSRLMSVDDDPDLIDELLSIGERFYPFKEELETGNPFLETRTQPTSENFLDSKALDKVLEDAIKNEETLDSEFNHPSVHDTLTSNAPPDSSTIEKVYNILNGHGSFFRLPYHFGGAQSPEQYEPDNSKKIQPYKKLISAYEFLLEGEQLKKDKYQYLKERANKFVYAYINKDYLIDLSESAETNETSKFLNRLNNDYRDILSSLFIPQPTFTTEDLKQIVQFGWISHATPDLLKYSLSGDYVKKTGLFKQLLCGFWFKDYIKEISSRRKFFKNSTELINDCFSDPDRFFIATKTIHVEEKENIQYEVGYSLNLNTGTDFSLSERGSSDSHFTPFSTGFSISIPGYNLSLGQRNQSQSQSTGSSNSISVSQSAYLVTQHNRFNVEIKSGEQCLKINVNPQAFLRTNSIKEFFYREYTLTDFFDSDLFSVRQRPTQQEIDVFFNRGLYICTGESESFVLDNKPLVVRENYYYVSQHFIAGHQSDPPDLRNRRFSMAIRGDQDYLKFFLAIHLSTKSPEDSDRDPKQIDAARQIFHTIFKNERNRENAFLYSSLNDLKIYSNSSSFPGVYIFNDNSFFYEELVESKNNERNSIVFPTE